MKFIAIVTLVFFITNCSEKANKHQNSVLKNNKADCEKTIDIRSLLIQLNNENKLKSTKIDTLINLFEKNEEIPSDSCFHFPSQDNDDKIFYYFIDKLTISTSNDWRLISQYIQIANKIRNNVEWSESLTENFHKIAMTNPEKFLKAYNVADHGDKKYIVNALGFLYEYDYLEVFKEKILQIENPKLNDTKSEIIFEINKMLDD